MKNIEMRLLETKEIERIYHENIVKDFAPDEVKPIERITELVGAGCYIVFGFFDNHNLVAYAYVVFNKEKNASLLDYYAVVDGYRNKGYGSICFKKLLSELEENYHAILLLEVERVEDGVDEEDRIAREMRFKFYKKNGMALTPIKIWLYDVYYIIFISKASLIFDAKEILHSIYQVLLRPDKINEKLRYESNIKLFVSDLDRTLLKSGGILSERTKNALLKAEEQGIVFVAASGRAFDTLPEEVKRMTCFSYSITSNGAGIQLSSKQQNESIYHKCIDSDVAKKLLNIYLEEKDRFDITLEAFVDGCAYCNKEYYVNPGKYGSESAKEYVQKTRKCVESIEDFVLIHTDELESIDFISCDERNRERVMKKLRDSFSSISVTSSIPHLIEIAHKDVSKGNALGKIMQLNKLRPENCISFGDAANDISLFETTGISVAVENADQNIANYVNYITKTNESDGVAEIIEKVLLI